MIANIIPRRPKYKTVGDWLELTGAEDFSRNIVRTMEGSIIIEPPNSTFHPVLKITDAGVEIFGPADYVEVNLSKLPLLDKEAKILDKRW